MISEGGWRRPWAPLASLSRAPQSDQAARVQVVRRPGRDPSRIRGRGRGRPERVGQVERLRLDPLGDRLDEPGRAARREARRRPVRRLGRPRSRSTSARSTCCSTTPTARGPTCRTARSRSRGACTRGGEGQYLVNKTPVRRIDVVELLSDVGLGGGLRSVISQGRVETVLNSKPSERRELIEEAAGLGRFKRRRHRAELKLARVGIQVERARDLEDEVKKRLRPLALQATAAERAEKLGVEIGRLQAAIATLDLARLAERRTEAEARRATTAEQRRVLEEKINALVAERERAEEELTDSAGAREQATAALYRLRSGGERIVLRRESAASLTASIRVRARGRAHVRPVSVGRDGGRRARCVDGRAGRRRRACTPAGRGRGAVGARRAIERGGQATLAAELDAVLERRAETESHLTGGSRDALLALRGATQRLGVRHESAQRLLAELRHELVEARHAPAGPSPAELGRAADEADAAARTAVREREDLDARVPARPRAPDDARAVARRARRTSASGTRARRRGRAARVADARGGSGGGALDRRRPRTSRSGGARGEPRARSRARREGAGVGSRLGARARRARSARAREAAGRRARRSCSPRRCPP